jgi:hypothetical protein
VTIADVIHTGPIRADVIEIVWTTLAAFGLGLVAAAWRDAKNDLRIVESRSRGREQRLECVIVKGDLTGARLLAVYMIANLAAGILAMLQEAPPTGRTPLGWTLIALLLAGAVATPLRLVDQRRRRRAIIRAEP